MTYRQYIASGDFQTRLRKLIKNCEEIVDQYKSKKVSAEEACDKLGKLEEQAYKEDQYAEPDGDYTYTVAMAIDEIYKLEHPDRTS
jgi:hypothetical protein